MKFGLSMKPTRIHEKTLFMQFFSVLKAGVEIAKSTFFLPLISTKERVILSGCAFFF